jgi:hypothetical protein
MDEFPDDYECDGQINIWEWMKEKEQYEREKTHDARPISVSGITAEYKGFNDKEKNTGLDK